MFSHLHAHRARWLTLASLSLSVLVVLGMWLWTFRTAVISGPYLTAIGFGILLGINLMLRLPAELAEIHDPATLHAKMRTLAGVLGGIAGGFWLAGMVLDRAILDVPATIMTTCTLLPMIYATIYYLHNMGRGAIIVTPADVPLAETALRGAIDDPPANTAVKGRIAEVVGPVAITGWVTSTDATVAIEQVEVWVDGNLRGLTTMDMTGTRGKFTWQWETAGERPGIHTVVVRVVLSTGQTVLLPSASYPEHAHVLVQTGGVSATRASKRRR